MATARAVLLHPRDNFSSPRRIGRRTRFARNCTNGRRERLIFTSKNVVVRLVVNQG